MAVITASSLFGYDTTSLAHLYLGSFSHLSRQILSSSVRLDVERCCTAMVKSLQSCSIRFKSGLWLDHSRTFRDLSRSPSCVVLAVCLGLLSCWKVNLRHWGPEHSGASFHQGSLCTLIRSSFPRSWLVTLTELQSLLVSAAWKTSPQHDAATTIIHHREGARLPPWRLAFKSKFICHMRRIQQV